MTAAERLECSVSLAHFGLAKPFVKWVGGKGQLIPQIAPHIHRQIAQAPIKRYIEPFVGGGAMLFYVLSNCPQLEEVIINDINPRLVACYRTVREQPEELIDVLAEYQADYYRLTDEEARRDYYLGARTRFNAGTYTQVEGAALFILINRLCFNGLYRVNRKGEYNVPFGKALRPTICDAQTLRSDSALLARTEILCGDYTEALASADEYTLVYFDPPYKPLNATSSFNSYSKEEFGDSEQLRLRDHCHTLDGRGASFILSNSDAYTPEGESYFDALYADYIVERVWAKRAVNAQADKRGKIAEVLIRNFD